jgi:hypothetical protein
MEFGLVRLFFVVALAPQPRAEGGASTSGKQLGPTDADINNYLNSIALDRRACAAEPNKLYRTPWSYSAKVNSSTLFWSTIGSGPIATSLQVESIGQLQSGRGSLCSRCGSTH